MEINKTIARKGIHVFTGIVCVFFISKNMTIYLSVFIFGSLIISLTPLFVYQITGKNITGQSGREEDSIPGIGGITYMAGIIITIFLAHMLEVDDCIVIGAIITLSVGDTLASITGKRLKGKCKLKIKHVNKSLFATFLAVLVSFFLTLLISSSNTKLVLFAGISIGLLLEFLLGHEKISAIAHNWCLDNFIIPISVVLTSVWIS